MSDEREHFGPRAFGGYVLEGFRTTNSEFFHVTSGGSDFIVHGGTVQDAIVNYMEKGPPKIRAKYTGTTAPPALKAAILEAVREWSNG